MPREGLSTWTIAVVRDGLRCGTAERHMHPFGETVDGNGAGNGSHDLCPVDVGDRAHPVAIYQNRDSNLEPLFLERHPKRWDLGSAQGIPYLLAYSDRVAQAAFISVERSAATKDIFFPRVFPASTTPASMSQRMIRRGL